MLKSITILFIRFISIWLTSSILVTLVFLGKSRLNYKYKFNEEWKCQLSYRFLDIFIVFLTGFFFLCLIYFLGLFFLKKNRPVQPQN